MAGCSKRGGGGGDGEAACCGVGDTSPGTIVWVRRRSGRRSRRRRPGVRSKELGTDRRRSARRSPRATGLQRGREQIWLPEVGGKASSSSRATTAAVA
ncbi:hypothetical protein E2562_016476 [Oryza meyeriana var. granulata]|uniref:Uncharacterized protein n=1 Tax=Oryza meyeriana var. granulata TaxID=110450 RepID=A0A6G1BLS9_9ORYZ|nr:hypothetical protein E2562_016476 [Oryza meyeriana var. granulata]